MALIENEIEKQKVEEPETEIIDIDLSPTRKKRFRINVENNRILELNISDMNIFSRLSETFPKLDELQKKAVEGFSFDDTEVSDDEALAIVGNTLSEIDKEMRSAVDYIFGSNVCEVCVPEGSMYDPFNGKFRYEYILEVISALYENNISAEVQALTKRVDKHTAKYTKKRAKK